MNERGLRALVAVIVFLGVLVLLFPTERLVHGALARALPPDGPVVTFERARIRPTGIWLEHVTLRGRNGGGRLAAPHARLRPAWLDLLLGGRGLPATVDADLCGGSAHARLTPAGRATAVALTWRDADLTTCPALALAGGVFAGRAGGAARLRLAPDAPLEGTGRIEVTEPTWRGTGLIVALRADAAALRWRLGAGRLDLEAVDLRSPAFILTGDGVIDLAEPIAASDVDLRLALTPRADGSETRRVSVTGTLAAPAISVE